MTDFVTGDLHLGHRKIPLYTGRRFCLDERELGLLDSGSMNWVPSDESINRMEEYLLGKINDTVGVDDRLYILGDFCFGPMGNKIGQWAERYRKSINCKDVQLIWGNHDNRRIAPVFQKTFERCRMRWGNTRIILTHCAHAVWEGSHGGGWHLYGHSHTTAEKSLDFSSSLFFGEIVKCESLQQLKQKVEKLCTEVGEETLLKDVSAFAPKRRSLDVGVDNAFRVFGEYRPLSFSEIAEYFETRPGHSMDNGVAVV